jgi:hypothetical protein
VARRGREGRGGQFVDGQPGLAGGGGDVVAARRRLGHLPLVGEHHPGGGHDQDEHAGEDARGEVHPEEDLAEQRSGDGAHAGGDPVLVVVANDNKTHLFPAKPVTVFFSPQKKNAAQGAASFHRS